MPETVSSIKAAGGDFLSIAAAHAWVRSQAAGQYRFDMDAFLIGGVDMKLPTGWTPDGSTYINYVPATGQEHAGLWTGGPWTSSRITVRCPYTLLEGVRWSSTGSNDCRIVDGTSNVTLRRLMMSAQSGIVLQGACTGITVEQCVLCGASGTGMGTAIFTAGTSLTMRACSLYNWNWGTYSYTGTATVTMVDCAVLGCITRDIYLSRLTATVTYCKSTDLTADDWGGPGNATGVTPASAWRAPATRDLMPLTGGPLHNAGTALLDIDTDVAGAARRSGAGQDIGAYELQELVAGRRRGQWLRHGPALRRVS